LDQKREDGEERNMELINQMKSPEAPARRDLLESIPSLRKRYGGLYYNDIIDVPYPTLKLAQKRTNYVRLAKKRAELGKFSDLYDNIQYDEN